MFSEISNLLLSEPEQTDPLTIKVIKKLKRIKQGTIFSSRCLGLKERKYDVNEVLRGLHRCSAIHQLADHVYIKSDERPDELTDEQLIQAVTLCEQASGHKIQTHGANACLKFNIPVEAYDKAFYTTNRTMNMQVLDSEIIIFHCPISTVFDHSIKIVCDALSAMHHLGEDNATTEHIALIYDSMTDDEFEAFAEADKPEWMNTLIWCDQ